jgi:hypothetical protein
MAWRMMAWFTLGAGIVVAAAAAARPLVPMTGAPPRALRAPRGPPTARYPADSLATRIAGRDPFRFDRHSAAVPYDPQRAAVAIATPYGPPKPALRLVGVVTGREPAALIEGLPGIEGGRVLRRGERIAGLTIAAIERRQVRVVGMDTVWVLTLRTP